MNYYCSKLNFNYTPTIITTIIRNNNMNYFEFVIVKQYNNKIIKFISDVKIIYRDQNRNAQ